MTKFKFILLYFTFLSFNLSAFNPADETKLLEKLTEGNPPQN